MGGFCKHEVVVFYYLRDNLLTGDQDPEGPRRQESTGTEARMTKNKTRSESPYDRLMRMVSAQSKEQLVKFLVALALENDEIESLIDLQ